MFVRLGVCCDLGLVCVCVCLNWLVSGICVCSCRCVGVGLNGSWFVGMIFIVSVGKGDMYCLLGGLCVFVQFIDTNISYSPHITSGQNMK